MNKNKRVIDNSKHPNPVISTAWKRGLDVLKPSAKQLEHGLELHSELLTCDNFAFMPDVWTKETEELWEELKEGNIGARELGWRMSLARYVGMTKDEEGAREFSEAFDSAGLGCMVLTVAEGKSREEDIKRMASNRQVERVFRHKMVQVGSVEEVREAREEGRTAVIWSINGPPMAGQLNDLDEELSWIDTWYQLGVRLMHLTYNRRNFIGDGCAEPANGGLSDLGFELVRKLNETGIIVDIPHSGERTTIDAAKASAKPMCASHTGAKGVFEHMRCKSDEALKAIADTDGLIGVYALPGMLGPNANLNTMLDHIDYIARLTDPKHLAIGTDYRYVSEWPEHIRGYPQSRYSSRWWGNWKVQKALPASDEAYRGSLSWSNWPLYTVGLVMRGYTDDQIAGILGENLMRVLKANQPASEVRLKK